MLQLPAAPCLAFFDSAADVVDDFAELSFTPPPTGIDDLLAQLPEPELAATARLAGHCDGEPREGGKIKRLRQQLQGMEPQQRLAEPVQVGQQTLHYGWELPRAISMFELRRGDLRGALKAFLQHIDWIPNNRKGARIISYARAAMIHTRMGEFDQAQAMIDEAQAWGERARRRDYHKKLNHDAVVTLAKAELAQAAGKIRAAEQLFRDAIRLKTEYREDAGELPVMHSRLAANLALQGRLLEAENEARYAFRLNVDRQRLTRTGQAQVIYRLAKVFQEQGRLDDARRIAAAAVWVYQDNCTELDSLEFANARATLAETLVQQRDYAAAQALYAVIADTLGAENRIFHHRFDADIYRALAEIENGHATQVSERLAAAETELASLFGDGHPQVALLRGIRALALQRAGQRTAARRQYEAALRVLSVPARRIGVGLFPLRVVAEGYLELLGSGEQVSGDDADTLYVLGETLRASKVQQSIDALGARAAISEPELATLLRKAQDATLRIEALQATLLRAAASGTESEQLRDDLQRLGEARDDLLAEVRDAYPDFAELSQPAPPPLRQLAKSLQPDEAIISTFVGEQQIYVWALDGSGRLGLHKVDMTRQQLRDEVNRIRASIIPRGATLDAVPPFAAQQSFSLYTALLAPLADIWQSKPLLYVIGDDALGHLPFATLITAPPPPLLRGKLYFAEYRNLDWLITRHAIVTLPAASTLATLRRRAHAPQADKPAIGFGDPVFAPGYQSSAQQIQGLGQRGLHSAGRLGVRAAADMTTQHRSISDLAPLPDTADEVISIMQVLGAGDDDDVYLGTAATEANVKAARLAEYRGIIFATHGLVGGELSGLQQPALALSAPEVVGGDDNGLLTMDEVMNLSLDADWVVLSACNTGSAGSDGAEALSGLGRAFFYAGARSLLVSSWAVETTAARLLTTGMFRRASTQHLNLATAQRDSMLDLLNQQTFNEATTGKPLFSYAHPFFWAPFSLVGNPISVPTTATPPPAAEEW